MNNKIVILTATLPHLRSFIHNYIETAIATADKELTKSSTLSTDAEELIQWIDELLGNSFCLRSWLCKRNLMTETESVRARYVFDSIEFKKYNTTLLLWLEWMIEFHKDKSHDNYWSDEFPQMEKK